MSNYITFQIRKKNGKMRTIEAPCPELKEKQRQVLQKLERTERLSAFCHSKKFRNIITNAMGHTQKDFVFKIDIKDFYNSITLEKFKNNIKIIKITDEELNICFREKDGEKYLTQGSPTSAFLSNLYMKSFDYQAGWYCYKWRVTYSRYADDLTFSGNDKKKVFHCIAIAKNLLKQYELEVNEKKNRMMKKTQRQTVCGVTVNKKVNIHKKQKKLKRLLEFLKYEKKAILTREQEGTLAYFQSFEKEYKIKSSLEICKSIENGRKVLEILTKN